MFTLTYMSKQHKLKLLKSIDIFDIFSNLFAGKQLNIKSIYFKSESSSKFIKKININNE